MSWQLDVALKAHCVSLGSQFLASFMQPHKGKAAAKWKRALFLGKADSQSSYVLFDGQ